MARRIDQHTRRSFLQQGTGAMAALATTPLWAAELPKTPEMTEGPFYPDKLPLDTDNDLVLINDSNAAAVGEITHLTGKVLGPDGDPIRSAFVEIWQVDKHGAYLHSGSDNRDQADKNFQGYGRCLTDREGRYYFRTIKPVPYPGRTPHIHVAVNHNGKRLLTSQLFVAGHPQNERDFLLQRVRDPAVRKSILVEFKKLPKSKIGELAANFDVVLGLTPDEQADGTLKGGLGRPQRRRPPR